MDYFIKATDEEAMWTALESAGLAEKSYDPEDALNQAPQDSEMMAEWQPSGAFTWTPKCQLDVIGVIYKQIDEETSEPLEGYHANLRGDLTEEQAALLPLINKPNHPHRVWAGD